MLLEPESVKSNLFYIEKQTEQEVLFSKMLQPGIVLQIHYQLRDSFGLDYTVRIMNSSGQELNLQDGLRLFVASGIGTFNKADGRYFSADILASADTKKPEKFRKVSNPKTVLGDALWVAQQNKYFAVIVQPKNGMSAAYIEPNGKLNKLSLRTRPILLLPGQSVAQQFFIYAGPKQEDVLKPYESQMEKVVSFWIF